MKKINWKIIAITGGICLLPIILGIAVYDKLPNEIAIHFNINNEPDNFASKEFVVFGLPCLMLLVQTTCCIANDLKGKKENPKIERFFKAIIPVLTILLYITTIAYALGNDLDIRKIACFVIGIIIVIIGNYSPKMKYNKSIGIHPNSFIKNKDVRRKINRISGYILVAIGLLFILSIFLTPIFSVAVLILTILVSLGIMIYSIYLNKQEDK